MSQINMGKASKVLTKTFIDSYKNVSEDEAALMVVEAIKKVREINKEKSEDEQLKAAKQITKDLGSAYRDAAKYEKAKIDWLLDRLDEIQSGAVNPTSSAK